MEEGTRRRSIDVLKEGIDESRKESTVEQVLKIDWYNFQRLSVGLLEKKKGYKTQRHRKWSRIINNISKINKKDTIQGRVILYPRDSYR